MLRNILPIDDIKRLFPDSQEKNSLSKADFHVFQQMHSNKLHALGLHQWDRICEWGPVKVEKFAIADFAATGKPGITTAIDSIIGCPLINDICYQRFTVKRNGKDRTVAQITVAHLYPGDLHLADIEFRHPDKPLPPEKRRPDRGFEGLGLLEPTISRLLQKAKNLNCRALTLTSANPELMELFSKHGFEISDTFIGRYCKENNVGGFPMEIRLQ